MGLALKQDANPMVFGHSGDNKVGALFSHFHYVKVSVCQLSQTASHNILIFIVPIDLVAI